MKKTKLERRLAVVKDAIKQVKANVFVASPGDVVVIPELKDKIWSAQFDSGEDGQAQPLLKELFKKGGKCQVCARGALLISTVHKENDFKLSEFEGGGCFDPDSGTDQRLLKLFSASQIALIEEAFENGSERDEEFGVDQLSFHANLSENARRKAHKFHDRYLDDNKRLLAILNNIVRNNGIFKP